jgi:predicted alpha/beta-hydrolase family hydrolase
MGTVLAQYFSMRMLFVKIKNCISRRPLQEKIKLVQLSEKAHAKYSKNGVSSFSHQKMLSANANTCIFCESSERKINMM